MPTLIGLDTLSGGDIRFCPSYRNIRYYIGYRPMQFLYDEPRDIRSMRFFHVRFIRPHLNVQILVGRDISADVIKVRISLRPIAIPGL